MTNGRRLIVRALLVGGGILAGLGLVAGHLNRNVVDGPTFADHVDAVRRDEAVATQVGGAMSDQFLRNHPDLIVIAPLVESIAIQVAGSDVLSEPVQRAAETAHAALTEPGRRDSVDVQISDGGAVAEALSAIAPTQAPVAAQVSVALASIEDRGLGSTTIAIAHVVDVLAWLLPLAAAACLVGAVMLARDRWRVAMQVGWAVLGAALGVGVVLVVGGFLVRRLDIDTLQGAVGLAVWDEFARPLWWGVVALALVGLTLILTFGSTVPDALHAQSVRLRTFVVRRPTTAAGIVVRAIILGAIGIAAVIDPGGIVEVAAFVGGVGLVLYAVTEISHLAQAARPATTAAEQSDALQSEHTAPRLGALVAGGVAIVLMVLGVATLARPGDDVDVAASPSAREVCNGHAELCERTFDSVAYVASHNSMSVAGAPGWFLAEQRDPIPVQLDQGVRALLIDVWSGIPADTVVRTAPGSYIEARAVTEEELGPDVVHAADQIDATTSGEPEGAEARYMCHGLCETGSTSFLETLIELRNWMEANPDEVVTLFIEDHVDPLLIAADIEAAGLLPSIHQPDTEAPWPTLGEMIRTGRRLVVMIEEGDGGTTAPWLVNGFEHTQDTPYTFPTIESFSCEPNRGPADASLLLLNHWLSGFTSLVTDAQQVNVRDVLLARAEQCHVERGQIPNFVAVNYTAIGDVVAVVDELNDVT